MSEPYSPRFVIRTLGKGLRRAVPFLTLFTLGSVEYMAAFYAGWWWLPIPDDKGRFLIAYPLAILVVVLTGVAILYVQTEANRARKP